MLPLLWGAATMPIIEINNLVKEYPKPDNKSENFRAVDNISLAIHAGEIYGILGPNGAGKTTTLEMLEGHTDIDSGEAFIDGISVKEKPFEVKKSSVCNYRPMNISTIFLWSN